MIDAKTLDAVNGFFELGASIVIWINVKRLWRDWEIKGVDWRVSLFFTLWGLFNLILFQQLNMGISTVCAVVLFLGNVTWSLMAGVVVMSR
jgi:hypothetical protein